VDLQLLQVLQELLLALLLLLHHLEVNTPAGSKGTCPKVLYDCLVMDNSFVFLLTSLFNQLLELDLRGPRWLGELEVLMNLNSKL
jgi:hypothetical protein